MRSLAKHLAATMAAGGAFVLAISPLAFAADAAPVGVWRATNDCFLAAFVLNDGGRAQAIYLSGERDEGAAWTWDGRTLKITSQTFPLDSFDGRLMEDRVVADYVWHDLDKDQLNRQACVFERFGF